MTTDSLPTLAVIGLEYVGLPLAVEFSKVRPVIGFDIRAQRIEELSAGRDDTLEVEPDELKKAEQLVFTSKPEALRDCGIFIVTVPSEPRLISPRRAKPPKPLPASCRRERW